MGKVGGFDSGRRWRIIVAEEMAQFDELRVDLDQTKGIPATRRVDITINKSLVAIGWEEETWEDDMLTMEGVRHGFIFYSGALCTR